MIHVTKTYLPPLEEYNAILETIWEKGWITNTGPVSRKLESELMKKLGCNDLVYVANGTLALQLAIRSMGIRGEVITTPYSYVATTSAILWENCVPVFCDIDPETLNIDPENIESAITENTSAIVATHVYGNPCDTEAINAIAKKHNLKVIYDAAHAFGVEVAGVPIFNFGDISISSFHATKLFHTVEGGGIINNTEDTRITETLKLERSFGHKGDDHISLGINAKGSEIHAAMGLCVLKKVDKFISKRRAVTKHYNRRLAGAGISQPLRNDNVRYNYSYLPVIFESPEAMQSVYSALKEEEIFPRRYFYPSLNRLPYIKNQQSCPVSEGIASRVLCMPIHQDLDESDVDRICDIILKNL